MDVIAHSGAIVGEIVTPQNIKVFTPTNGNLGNIRHEVVWGALRVFANQAACVGTNGVKAISLYTTHPTPASRM